MKNKNEKMGTVYRGYCEKIVRFGFLSLPVLFAVCALLFASCKDLFNFEQITPKSGLKINVVNEEVARTLYPDETFTSYRLYFVGPENFGPVDIVGDTSIFIEELPIGLWTITAYGYVTIDGEPYPAASGSRVVDVKSSVFETVEISINATQDGPEGYFTYNVDYHIASPDSAGLWFYLYGTPRPVDPEIDFLESALKGSLYVDPGYYWMVVRIVDGPRVATRTEIVHIYSNMETFADILFTSNDFTDATLLVFEESTVWEDDDDWARWVGTITLDLEAPIAAGDIYILNYSFISDVNIDLIGANLIDNTGGWKELSNWSYMGGEISRYSRYSGTATFYADEAAGISPDANNITFHITRRDLESAPVLLFEDFTFKKVTPELSETGWHGFAVEEPGVRTTAEHFAYYDGRDNVLYIKPGLAGYGAFPLQFDIDDNYPGLAGQEVLITIEVDVWLPEEAAKISWEINQDDYYAIAGSKDDPYSANTWHTLKSTYVTVLKAGSFIGLSGFQIENAEAYFGNFSLTIVTDTYVYPIPFDSETDSLDFTGIEVKNLIPWTTIYSYGLVVNIDGDDFDVTQYSHIKMTANFYDEDGEFTDPGWGDLQFKFFTEEVYHVNYNTEIPTIYNFGLGDGVWVLNPGYEIGSRIITYPIPADAKPVLWGFGVQSSSGENGLNIKYVEITAVEFIPGEPCRDCGEYPCECEPVTLVYYNDIVLSAMDEGGTIEADYYTLIQEVPAISVVKVTVFVPSNSEAAGSNGWGIGNFGGVAISNNGASGSSFEIEIGVSEITTDETNIWSGCYFTKIELWVPEDFAIGDWVDPATQTTQLTGGTLFERPFPEGGGPQDLPGSPYNYEIFDYEEEGPGGLGDKFTWYGPDLGGGGAFKAEWDEYLLARLGFYYGDGGHYSAYNNIYIDYNYRRSDDSTSPWGMIGAYGWSRNPSATSEVDRLVEWYIVDDWFFDGQYGISNVDGTHGFTPVQIGSFEADGATYIIYITERDDFNIDGKFRFKQLLSVRQGRRTYGTISVSKHFEKWAELGYNFENLYEAKFKVEAGGGGNGWLDLSYLYLEQEAAERPPSQICIGG